MNFLQLVARRLGQAFAVLWDPDAGLLRALPEPVVDPRVNADRLANTAREQGRIDGERFLYDGWSFGREDEPPDAILEPAYVQRLRENYRSAVHEHRDRQRLTEARLADLHLMSRDAELGMRAARERMARIAVRDQLDEEDSLRAFLHRRNINADTMALPPLRHPVWEGEAPPMHPAWRVFLIGFLLAVVFQIEHYVAEAYLSSTVFGPTTGILLTAAITGLTILGPLVAGQLFRHRHATGSDGILAALTFVLLLPAVAIVLGFGLLAARLFDRGGVSVGTAAAASQSAALGLTPTTVIIVFDVVLFLACSMSYILGLAQKHPFQQAFARSRRQRNRTILLAQRMGTRINPDYRAALEVLEPAPDRNERAAPHGEETEAPQADSEAPQADPDADRELAIRHAYLAAENAYYQGLIEAVADPTFTEAVMRRRNRGTVLGNV